MEGLLSLVGMAVAALLAVAIAVAWWEQTGAGTRARAAAPVPQHARPVDVHLDHLADDAAGPDSDLAARHAVLGGAMARMSQGTAPASASLAWMDTQPMVAPGTREKTRPQDNSAARRPAPESEPSTET